MSSVPAKLFLAVVCFILCMQSYHAFLYQIADGHLQVYTSGYDSRVKREAAILRRVGEGEKYMRGMLAEKQLLINATTPMSFGKYITYKKDGGYGRAMRDFLSVDPVNIQTTKQKHGVGMFGVIGDRTIIILEHQDLEMVTVALVRKRKAGKQTEKDIIIYYFKDNVTKNI